MSDSSWDLVIPVLVIGLTLGLVWVLRWRRRSGEDAEKIRRDRELVVADLEARQTLLIDQLREARDDEREELELAAARNLMALEEAGGGRSRSEPVPRDVEVSTEEPAVARRGTPGWFSFLGGVVTAALVGILIVWAGRDATPRPVDEVMQAPESPRHPDGLRLSEQDAAAIAQLARRIENDPTDLMARKQYAVGLLSTGQFFAAFEQSEILLGSDPRDPDGLYVKGMVRMRMGLEEEARSLLDTLIADRPDHVAGLTAMGVLVLRQSGLAAAEEYWHLALAASGGTNPEIERLMETARQQMDGRALASTPAASAAAALAPTEAPGVDGPAYTLHLELASGSSVPPTALLFVSLRAATGGPPAAVRRIERPRFPLTLTLSAADSMMGQPLPEEGTIAVRLDFDGNASTREDGEPEASRQMRVGDSARLTLE